MKMVQLARIAKHPLVGIEEAANAAIASEDESPTVTRVALAESRKVATIRVGGFVVNDGVAEQVATETAIAKRRDAVAKYKHDRDQIIGELQEREITPLAVVPKAAWEQLCDQSGLFRICPDESGRVMVSASVLEGFEKRKKASLKYFFWVLMLNTAIISGCITRFVFHPIGPLEVITAPLGALVAFICFGITLYGDTENMAQWEGRMVKLQIKLFSMKSWKTILSHLLPNSTSPDSGGSSRHQLYAKVILPQPPADVASVLLKARRMKLHVAAVAHAITFAEPVGDILNREHDRIMDEEAQQRERERQASLDPIVYVVNGSAVAIIAQFGDFPIEQRVVDQVMNSEFLL